jgi:hypothetical protein
LTSVRPDNDDRQQETHMATEAQNGIVWLSDEEAVAFFDRNARALLGISGEEFLRRWDAGEFHDRFDVDPDITSLVMLMPFAGRDPR